MGYVSFEDAQKLSRASLIVKFIETQTLAAAAISEAITLGGNKAEQRILQRYEERLPIELRQKTTLPT